MRTVGESFMPKVYELYAFKSLGQDGIASKHLQCAWEQPWRDIHSIAAHTRTRLGHSRRLDPAGGHPCERPRGRPGGLGGGARGDPRPRGHQPGAQSASRSCGDGRVASGLLEFEVVVNFQGSLSIVWRAGKALACSLHCVPAHSAFDAANLRRRLAQFMSSGTNVPYTLHVRHFLQR